MLVGIPTNNLNRIFSTLTPTLAKGDFGPNDIADSLGEGQKYWPSDTQVADALIAKPFYFTGQPHQRRLVLDSLTDFFAGKEPAVLDQNLTIEHIMPQTATSIWLDVLDSNPVTARQLHEQYVHTIGNLTLTGYNSELGNKSYQEKSSEYKTSSLAINRLIAESFEKWDVQAIKDRTAALTAAIVSIWPGPTQSSIDIVSLSHAAIEDSLLLLPAGAWTRIGDVIELSGLPLDEVSYLVATLPESLRERVHQGEISELDTKGHYDSARLAALLTENDEGL